MKIRRELNFAANFFRSMIQCPVIVAIVSYCVENVIR